jgi:hypothetical protein
MTADAAYTEFAAKNLVTNYCGWHIGPSVNDTIILDGSGGRSLLLPSLRVTEVSAVSVDGTLLNADQYDWSASGIVELRCGVFTSRLRGVTVTLTHGYDLMPDDVQNVINGLIDRAGTSTPGVQQVGQVRYWIGSDGIGVGLSLSAADRAVLAPYKLVGRS